MALLMVEKSEILTVEHWAAARADSKGGNSVVTSAAKKVCQLVASWVFLKVVMRVDLRVENLVLESAGHWVALTALLWVVLTAL